MMERPPRDSATAHILVMDDAPAILDLLREILEDEGYRVTTSQARLDLPHLRAVSPDAIVQELRFAGMPALDDQVFATVRSDPALAHIPIILCTTYTDVIQDEAIATHLRQLRVRVVRKPFVIDELLKVLAEAFAVAREEVVRDFPVARSQCAPRPWNLAADPLC